MHCGNRGSGRLTREPAVAYQFANVHPPDFKIVYGQCSDTAAFHRKRANGETPDSERADRGGAEGERTKCDGAKTERVIDARWLPVFRGGQRLNRSNSPLPKVHVVHGVPRSSAIGFDDLVKRSELLIEGQGQRE
jgi:hypothetical protein